MRHATAASLHALAPLLAQLRALPGLVERRPGIFYLRAHAFLHFHEDAAGLFADVKLDRQRFERHTVSTPAQQQAVLAAIARVLADGNPPRSLAQ
ncbi:MAG: hypothetical protein LCH73_08700 [Proteobacteria bacterium]|nr:hypothetical protein [Pseudomonadota bacterium]